jgi:hypothetical protein
MHSLSGIIAMNAAAVRRAHRNAETETTRHCSFAGDAQNGVVLHSAKQRSTVFVKGGAAATAFLAKWFGTNSDTRRDSIVESFFS